MGVSANRGIHPEALIPVRQEPGIKTFCFLAGAWRGNCIAKPAGVKGRFMMPSGFYHLAQVSESMIRGVFSELKSNGYTEHQILALSTGLMEMASEAVREENTSCQELDDACCTGLPRQI